jgi:hypothetical protein
MHQEEDFNYFLDAKSNGALPMPVYLNRVVASNV